MTMQEAANYLREKRVHDGMYSIGSLGGGENVGIRQVGDGWEVFFNERGSAASSERFSDEATAVDAFLKRVDKHLVDYGGDGIFG